MVMATGWGSAITEAARRLTAAGVDSPRVDAELIAAHVAGVTRGRLVLAPDPDDRQLLCFTGFVERRARREPLQHVLGTAAFWRGELSVGPGVFVPRPETELVVEWTLAALRPVVRPVVVDLCAGSGAIGHAILGERPDAALYAVERHDEALVWLRHNMKKTTAVIVAEDAGAPNTLRELNGLVDAVVSNPPYVPSGAAAGMSPEVAADPPTALYSGPDGLDLLRRLVPRAAALLRPGGVFAVEHDDTHRDAVPDLLRRHGFTEVVAHRDLADRPRFCTGRRAAQQ